eukprot:272841_1
MATAQRQLVQSALKHEIFRMIEEESIEHKYQYDPKHTDKVNKIYTQTIDTLSTQGVCVHKAAKRWADNNITSARKKKIQRKQLMEQQANNARAEETNEIDHNETTLSVTDKYHISINYYDSEKHYMVQPNVNVQNIDCKIGDRLEINNTLSNTSQTMSYANSNHGYASSRFVSNAEITQQSLYNLHQRQLLNNRNNDNKTLQIVETLGGIDTILSNYLTRAVLSKQQLIQINRILCDTEDSFVTKCDQNRGYEREFSCDKISNFNNRTLYNGNRPQNDERI